MTDTVDGHSKAGETRKAVWRSFSRSPKYMIHGIGGSLPGTIPLTHQGSRFTIFSIGVL